jgi:ankyrin repeat protein
MCIMRVARMKIKRNVLCALLVFTLLITCSSCCVPIINIKKKEICSEAIISAALEGNTTKIAEIVGDKTTCCHIDLKDGFGFTALMYASQMGYLDAVKILLQNGADPNLQNRYGVTALMLASGNGYSKAVIELIKSGADPNLVNKYGASPLISAAGMGYADVVTILLKNGADPNKKIGNMSVLYAAIHKNRDEVAKKLRKAGAKL